MKKMEHAHQKSKSATKYHQYANDYLESLLNRIDDVAILKKIFLESFEKSTMAQENQHRLQFENPYSCALYLIISRLVKMNSFDSYQTLIELRKNRNIQWDGGLAVFADEAIFRGGESVTPILEEDNTQ